MRRIPTMFKRDPENTEFVINIKNNKCLWVFEGEGIAAIMFDGLCCMIKDGALYRQRVVRDGGQTPSDFIEVERDFVGKKIYGWVPVKIDDSESTENLFFKEALDMLPSLDDGTYELCGPDINGNPHGYGGHRLVSHRLGEKISDCPREFDDLKVFIDGLNIKGIVFHHPDGEMAKIKGSDFGLKIETADLIETEEPIQEIPEIPEAMETMNESIEMVDEADDIIVKDGGDIELKSSDDEPDDEPDPETDE